MQRLFLALWLVCLLDVAAFAGPYIVCYQMQPSGRVNYWGEPVYCAEMVKLIEWERDSYNTPAYDGQRLCPRGTIQRFYGSYHHVGEDVDLCP